MSASHLSCAKIDGYQHGIISVLLEKFRNELKCTFFCVSKIFKNQSESANTHVMCHIKVCATNINFGR